MKGKMLGLRLPCSCEGRGSPVFYNGGNRLMAGCPISRSEETFDAVADGGTLPSKSAAKRISAMAWVPK